MLARDDAFWHVGLIRSAGYVIDGSFLSTRFVVISSSFRQFLVILLANRYIHIHRNLSYKQYTYCGQWGVLKGLFDIGGIWWFGCGVPLVIAIHQITQIGVLHSSQLVFSLLLLGPFLLLRRYRIVLSCAFLLLLGGGFPTVCVQCFLPF